MKSCEIGASTDPGAVFFRRPGAFNTIYRRIPGKTAPPAPERARLPGRCAGGEALAATARVITEQKRAARELRGLHARVTSAQETERRRLARDLHDGVGQILSGVKYRLEALSGKSGRKGGDGAQIVEISALIGRAISEIRRVSKNLMPSELQDLGLEPALRTICREFKECAGVEVRLRTGSVPEAVAPEVALALFRIAQEALNNIGKHSRATRVAVELARKGRDLVLSVGDNGVGFRPAGDRPLTGRGLGLGSMRERAESVGGSIVVHSAPGAGTTLCVHAPLSGADSESCS